MIKYRTFLDKVTYKSNLDLEKLSSENINADWIWILYRELFDIYQTNGEGFIEILVEKRYNIGRP